MRACAPCVAVLLVVLGFILGALNGTPPDASFAARGSSQGQRASPLGAVTRELAAERKRAQELSESLAEERNLRKGCARRAVQVAASPAWHISRTSS